MATDNDNVTIRLLRERAAKLEATCSAYDRMLNTAMADTLRRRNAELEGLLWEVALDEAVPVGVREKLKISLGKVMSKY